jgi:hypothetical protein
MSVNLLNKYVWLVETIYKNKYISFEDINRKWLRLDMAGKIKRMWNKYKEAKK